MATGPVAGAVGTLMTNMALEVAFKEMGIGFARAKVGDRYVLEMMQERGWILGGEGSGHLLALDKHTTGDGIVSALQVLSASRSGQSPGRMLQRAEAVSADPDQQARAAGLRLDQGFGRGGREGSRRARTGRHGRVLIRRRAPSRWCA
jgi:phosphoglucosamine mutase